MCKNKVQGELSATTSGLTQELTFKPASGTIFAEFAIEGCSGSELNTTYKVEGSVRGQTEGATTNFTEKTVTEDPTDKLTLGGLPAGIGGTNGTTLAIRSSTVSRRRRAPASAVDSNGRAGGWKRARLGSWFPA